MDVGVVAGKHRVRDPAIRPPEAHRCLQVRMSSRTSNGVFFRVGGDGEPLLLLHGVMAAGAMFDPLVELLQDRFRMLIPDLRGHGRSGDLVGPYDVQTLASDLDVVLADARFDRCAVMGYSHGGAVAQQLARNRPVVVSRLILACTYACNVSTLRERVECGVFLALLGCSDPERSQSSSCDRRSRARPARLDSPASRPRGCGRCWPPIEAPPCAAR